MLDFELAKLYGYETKNLNRQVKNHIDLFNENILFKLTKNTCQLRKWLKLQVKFKIWP